MAGPILSFVWAELGDWRLATVVIVDLIVETNSPHRQAPAMVHVKFSSGQRRSCYRSRSALPLAVLAFTAINCVLPMTTVMKAPAVMAWPHHQRQFHLQPRTVFQMSKDPNASPITTGADFERQELRIQLAAIAESGRSVRDLNPTQQRELEGYVRKIVESCPSPVPLKASECNSEGHVLATDYLPNSTWRLVLSTDSVIQEALPRDATVVLRFHDTGSPMEYSLDFGKQTMGLNRITALSDWEVDTNNGSVSITYDRITTDVFGLRNINVGFFGLLQGRGVVVSTAWFDGALWIERVRDEANESGDARYNVYARDDPLV
jgi:hypothetical protein